MKFCMNLFIVVLVLLCGFAVARTQKQYKVSDAYYGMDNTFLLLIVCNAWVRFQ